MSQSDLHCHHCQRWLGETSQSLGFVGMFQAPRDRQMVDAPRDTYRCKSCGWITVFRPQTVVPQTVVGRDYRSIELKAS